MGDSGGGLAQLSVPLIFSVMSVTKLKKKLDVVFSRYVRTRDLDDNGRATCFTCGVQKPWKELHAGHFQSRSKLATRFDEVNVQVQCPRCNLWNQGEQYQFALNLDEHYGAGTAQRIVAASNGTRRISAGEYQQLIAHYEAETQKNLEEGGRTR